MYSGHYTTSINCCKTIFNCSDSKITKFEIIDTKSSTTSSVAIYQLIMYFFFFFGLEQEYGSWITPMALAHPLHPVRSRLRNKHWNMWVGCVSSWRPWFWSIYSIHYYIHTMNYSCILRNWYNLFLIPQSHRTATSLRSVKSARSPLIATGLLWDLIQRCGSTAAGSKISKVTEVAAKFWTCPKQAQWGRRGNRTP